jgi:hypothetical protein
MRRSKYKQSTNHNELLSCEASLGELRTDSGEVTNKVRGIYVSTANVPRRLTGVCGSAYNTYQYSDVDAHAVNALEIAGAGKWERSSYLINDGESARLRYEVLNPDWNIVNQKVGDDFSVGLEFSTGHQGYLSPQSIACDGFITRLACLNGMKSNNKMFRRSVKHFNRDKVDKQLVESINDIVRNLSKMVDWFVSLHDVKISRQEGVNALKRIQMKPSVRKSIIDVWQQPHKWRGIEDSANPSSRHLGNLLNVSTQVTTHEHSRENIGQSEVISARVFDELVAMSRDHEYLGEMVQPIDKRTRGAKVEVPVGVSLPPLPLPTPPDIG